MKNILDRINGRSDTGQEKKKKSDFEDTATGNETKDVGNKINRAIKNNGTTTKRKIYVSL